MMSCRSWTALSSPRAAAADQSPVASCSSTPAAASSRPFSTRNAHHKERALQSTTLAPRGRLSQSSTRLPASTQQQQRTAPSRRVPGVSLDTVAAEQPWEANEAQPGSCEARPNALVEAAPTSHLGVALLLSAAAALAAAEPASAASLSWATRDMIVSKDLFLGASLFWNASQLTGTMFLTSRFMMSWFPKVESARAEEPWRSLARPVDLVLDPTIRRLYGLRERVLIRARADDDGDVSGEAKGGPAGRRPPRYVGRDGKDDRVTLQTLGGVDPAAPTALALLMCLGEALGPSGFLQGADIPQALLSAHESVSALQFGSLMLSWWLLCARFFTIV